MVHIRGNFEPNVVILSEDQDTSTAPTELPSLSMEALSSHDGISSSPSNQHYRHHNHDEEVREIQRSIQICLPSFEGLPTVKGILSMIVLPFISVLRRMFEQALSTRQLYTVSIVLLCCHQMLQLLWRKMPLFLIKIFIYLGVDKNYLDIYIAELLSRQTTATTTTTSPSIASSILTGTRTNNISWTFADLEALDRIVQSILHDFYIHMNAWIQNFQQANKVAAFFNVPITAIMIPTTILSFFLLLTMTTYLVFHLLFQIIIHLTRSEDGFMSHSPIVMASITLILIMEYLLPWIFFCTGLNLSIYAGGSNWGYFTTLMYFGWIAFAWNRWNYTSYATNEWKMTWGFDSGPRGRKGHSLVVWNETKIIMFGGRDNDVHRHHVPKTFELVNEDEVMKFASYDGKPLSDEYDPTCQPKIQCFSLDNQTNDQSEICSYSWDHMLEDVPLNQRKRVEEMCGFTTTGLFYNDVWVYDMACTRVSDEPCIDDGWKVLHPGMKFGGCKTEENGDRVCEIPAERWNHGAAMIDASTMVVYGGYSHECQDYCDDVWAFDFDTLSWNQINIDSIDGPGKRWKSSMISIESKTETESSVVIFGGHRLWHGFAPENSEENKWNSTESFPKGGFLNDMWSLRKVLDLNDENMTEISWIWSQHMPKQSCVSSPGIGWEERNRVQCETLWPTIRSGHAATYDKKKHGMWVHGGYAVHYPYPSSSSPGSDWGVKGRYERGFIPFGTQSYFLDDLWFFNFSSGMWNEIIPADSRFPRKRMEHVIVAHEDTLVLHGGFSDNIHFNDTWYFNIADNTWLEKTSYVHALFPTDCTDDVEQILIDKTCIELDWPKPLQRVNESKFEQAYREILPFSQQDGYTPSAESPLYFGIVDDVEVFVSSLRKTYIENITYDEHGNQKWLESSVPEGTPIAPYAATGPRQYAKLKSIQFNESLQLDIWEWCISVKGEPHRHVKHNQGDEFFIPQPRRQTVGWDGCRELRWVYPTSRSGHKAIFVESYKMIVMYGGISYSEADYESGLHPNTLKNEKTFETEILNDMWIYGIDSCPRNCSNHGDCLNGFCKCDSGYYGLDCSNVTCPGTTCYYDEDHVQHCSHCCYDGFVHTEDNTQYMTGIDKVPCVVSDDGIFSGVSNGICDGFGSCQCVFPFIGEDCSVRDCPHDCNGNGLCSIEFPNARCICDPGFKGEYCQFKDCLNNCSFPNGECDHSKGVCRCNKVNLSLPPDKADLETWWVGDDCSYIFSSCSIKSIRWGYILPFLFIISTII